MAQLWEAARAGGAQRRFEAAVGGVVPVIRVPSESLAGAHVDRVRGIVNGSTNFIPTQMAATGASYEEALKAAQDLGYAEADPTEDVAAATRRPRWRCVARLAFGVWVHLDEVTYEGSRASHRRRHGLRATVRPRAEAARHGGAHRRRDRGRRTPAGPVRGAPAASVSGPFDAVTIESPAVTEVTLSGRAPGPQTASDILGDVVQRDRRGPVTGRGGRGRGEDRARRPVGLYLCLEVADRPASWRRWPSAWARRRLGALRGAGGARRAPPAW